MILATVNLNSTEVNLTTTTGTLKISMAGAAAPGTPSPVVDRVTPKDMEEVELLAEEINMVAKPRATMVLIKLVEGAAALLVLVVGAALLEVEASLTMMIILVMHLVVTLNLAITAMEEVDTEARTIANREDRAAAAS